MESVAQRPRNDRQVIGLLCSGHFLSHFYFLALPPMFPLLKAEFGVSYVELGLAITAYNLLGGFAQAPVETSPVSSRAASRYWIGIMVQRLSSRGGVQDDGDATGGPCYLCGSITRLPQGLQRISAPPVRLLP